MSQFITIPEIITYEDDDFIVTSVVQGVATLTSQSSSSTVITVPGGVNDTGRTKVAYNCFTNLNNADDYHARRLNNTVWRTADEDTRTSALFWATDILHRQSWIGAPTVYEQALTWPRRFVPNRNSILQGFSGQLEYIDTNAPVGLTFKYFDDQSMPKFLQDATAELALYLIKRANSGKDEVSQYTDQLSSLSLGGGAVNLAFREDNDYITDMPYQVYHIISDFLKEVKEFDPSVKAVRSVSLHRR